MTGKESKMTLLNGVQETLFASISVIRNFKDRLAVFTLKGEF